MMKRKLTRLSRGYATALQQHLQPHPRQNPRATLQRARGLGRRAAAMGLETLDVAKIHEAAFASLEALGRRDGIIKRAELFFAEAITPIERTHRAALTANARLNQLNKTLGRRTVDLAAANRFLEQGVAQRQAVEQALQKSAEHYARSVKESRRLEKHLRHLTHRILATQEKRRTRISRTLHDEIAQTLLGINVRLLTLKKEAAVNMAGLKKEIASTQRLVEKSVKTMSRFGHEFGKHRDT